MPTAAFSDMFGWKGLRVLMIWVCVARAASAQTTLSNPNWEITIDDYGYSDLAFDLRPGYYDREYLSGEWAAAVSYRVNSVNFPPTWLNPDFIFPDWQSNSDFGLESVQWGDTNAYGFDVLSSVITNAAVRIRITSEMIDSTNGIPQGITPRSGLEHSCTTSDRYIFRQSFEISNISGASLSELQFFKFIHSLQATRVVYDDHDYGPALGGHHYTVSQTGYDIGYVGSTWLKAVHFDTVALHANVPPSAWEGGRYGVEGVDDHSYGKPSVGVHWSVESNSLSGADSFAPTNKWVGGAMRFDLGALAPDASTNLVFLMSLRTLTASQTGSLVAWGDNSLGQCNVPGGLEYATAIAAGSNHSLAVLDGGSVIAWGDNSLGQCSVPALNAVGKIAAGGNHSLALEAGGSVVAWGDNSLGQCNVPASLSNATAIAAGGSHSLALRDGMVVAWGDNSFGQCNVPGGLEYVTAIAAGGNHSLALEGGGSVVAWGDNSLGQCNVPAGLTNATAIAAGGNHSLVLRDRGRVNAWGGNSCGQTDIPAKLGRVMAIGAGGNHNGVITVVPPAIGISLSGPNVTISWSAAWSPAVESVVLEQASTIWSNDWTEVPSSGTMQSVLFKVDVPAATTWRFFRLRIP